MGSVCSRGHGAATQSSSSVAELVTQTRPPAHTDTVASLALCHEGVILTGSEDKSCCLINCDDRVQLNSWRHHTRGVTQVSVGRAGSLLSASRDTTIHVWNISNSSNQMSLQGHEAAVNGCSFSDGGDVIMSGSRDSRIKFWDTKTGSNVHTAYIARNVSTCIRSIPSSQTMLQSGEDKQLRVWDLRTFTVASLLPIQNYIHTSCCVSDDGLYYCTSSNGFGGNGCTATVWDARSKLAVVELRGHAESVLACYFVPSSNWVVTSSKDGSVRLWNRNDGRCLASQSNSTSFVTSLVADNRRIICGLNDGSIEELQYVSSASSSSSSFTSWTPTLIL